MAPPKRLPYQLDRRNVVAAMTLAGAGGLAGCLGDDDDDDDDDTVDPGDDDDDTPTPGDDDDVEMRRVSDSIGAQITQPLEMEEYNQWADETDPPLRFWISTPGFATHRPTVSTYHDGLTYTVGDREISAVLMTTDVEIHDNESMTVSIRDDIPSWTGDTVTVQDFFKVNEIWHLETQFESDDWEPWEDDDSIVIEDDFTYTENFDPTPMPQIEWQKGLWTKWDEHMYWPDGTWIDEYVERLRDAASQDEVDEILSDLEGHNVDGWDILEEQIGYGPYIFDPDDATDTEVVGYVNEDHPAAEYIDIPELVLHIAEEGSEREDLLEQEGMFDIRNGVHTQVDLETMEEEVPDHFEQMAVYQNFGSTQILFNWDHKDLGNRWVRRAIVEATHVPNMFLNADQEVDAASAEQNQYWAYMSAPVLETWVDEDVLNEFHQYTPENNFDQAAEFMEEGGYEQDGDGLWVDENGDPVQLELLAGAWDELTIYMETMRSNLEEFGFQADLVTVDEMPMYDRIDENQYDIVPMWIGGGDPFPWQYYRTTPGWQEVNFIRRVEGLTDWVWEWEVDEEDRPDTDVQGRPLNPVIPEEPGALEVEGDGIELDSVQMVQDLMDGNTSRERQREITELFARWANYDVPDFWMSEGDLYGYMANTRDFMYPDDPQGREMIDEFISHDEYLILTGMVQPRYEEV